MKCSLVKTSMVAFALAGFACDSPGIIPTTGTEGESGGEVGEVGGEDSGSADSGSSTEETPADKCECVAALCEEFNANGESQCIEQLIVKYTLGSGELCEVNERAENELATACSARGYASWGGYGIIRTPIDEDTPRITCKKL